MPGAKAAAAACPYLAGKANDAGSDGQLKCPLGYGGDQAQKLSHFHCVLCKSLLCDCVRTECDHIYCRGCIARFQDCPVCGAAVGSVRPDPEIQAAVELYIEKHADSHSIWELEGLGAGALPAHEPRGRANFLLQLGLRALAFGNLDAGRHWLESCQKVLEAALEAANDENAAAKGDGNATAKDNGNGRLEVSPRCALATVHGCLGDCARSCGDAGLALEHYAASVQLLESTDAAKATPEVSQTLSVTLNKMAELHHMQGDLQSAVPLYRRALAIRQRLLAVAEEGEGWAELALPTLTSLVKTADAEAAVPEETAAAAGHLEAARELLSRVEEIRSGLAPAQQARLVGLERYLENH